MKGWQQTYRDGLAALDAAAAGFGLPDFASMPAVTRDLLIRAGNDALITDLVDVAFLHTLDAMYGAPEYGGNRDLAGWGFTAYDGDVQPRGFTDEQVTQPDNPGLFDLLPLPLGSGVSASRSTGKASIRTAALLPVPKLQEALHMENVFRDLIAMTSDELSLGMLQNSQSSLSKLRNEVGRLVPKGDK